jgi:hypothetical protein
MTIQKRGMRSAAIRFNVKLYPPTSRMVWVSWLYRERTGTDSPLDYDDDDDGDYSSESEEE